MGKIRVPLHGYTSKFAVIEQDATVGARIGTNLFNADGSLFDPATLEPAATPADPATPPASAYNDAMADERVAAGIADHVAAADPHTQYITAAELAAALAGISGGVLPLVSGDIVSGQPQLIYDPDDGTLIYEEIS